MLVHSLDHWQGPEKSVYLHSFNFGLYSGLLLNLNPENLSKHLAPEREDKYPIIFSRSFSQKDVT